MHNRRLWSGRPMACSRKSWSSSWYGSLSQTAARQHLPKTGRQECTYRSQEALSHETGSCVQEELHLRDFLVDVLHELDDKVDQLVLQHLFGVEVCDQERNIIALPTGQSTCPVPHAYASTSTYIDRLPPQDEEGLRSLGQEPRELVYQDVLDLIRLLYPYADSHAVH